MKERKAHKMTVGEEAAQISLGEKRKVRRKKPKRGRGGREEGAGRNENELPPPPPPILRPGARDKGKQQRWEMERRDLGQGVAGTSQGSGGGGHGLPHWETASRPPVPDLSSFPVLFKPGLQREPGREMRRPRGREPERPTRGTQGRGGVGTIKPFNIKAGNGLQNPVQPSPFMGGNAARADTLLM